MKVTVIAKEINTELIEKLGFDPIFIKKKEIKNSIDLLEAELVFFTDIKISPKAIILVQSVNKNALVVYNAVSVSLEELKSYGVNTDNVIGMNLLPSFINRDLAEVTTTNNALLNTLTKLGWVPKIVDSRVGLVTPRIICMIINEAYFTVQENTANKQDIDTGMKLGTNYPFGPFEWAQKIGLKNVVYVLKRMFEDTQEGRYKICPLLKKESMLGM